MRVQVKAHAIIKIEDMEFEVPIAFSTEVDATDSKEQRYEVYHKLKKAALGFGEYSVSVLE